MESEVRSSDVAQPSHILRDVLLIVILSAVILLPSHFTRGLWNPDEPRYMEVAREMTAGGDYLVPHLNGDTYPEKGPLFFWLTAAVYQVTGSFNSGRTVAAVVGLGTLLLVYFLGRRLLPSRGGLLAALSTLTLFLFFYIAKDGVMDPLMMFLETAALTAAYFAMESEKPRARWLWLIFYGATAFASLTKGPVGFFAPAVVVLIYALLSRKCVRLGGWAHLAGSVLLIAIACAWLVPAILRAGWVGYGDIVLLRQSLSRAYESYSHQHGPHYYIMQLPLYLFPWVFFAILGTVAAFLDWRRKGDRAALFMALWFVAILLFFTVISGKRERYLLPMLPAVGLLTARYFMNAVRDGVRWPRLHKWFAAVTFDIFGLIGIVLCAAPFAADKLAVRFAAGDPDAQQFIAQMITPAVTAAAVITGLGLIALAVLGHVWTAKRMNLLRVATLLLVLTTALSLFGDLVLFAKLNPIKSSKNFDLTSLPYLKQADKSYMYVLGFSGAVNLYTGITHIPIIESDEKLAGAQASADAARKLAQALSADEKVVVVGDERQILVALPVLPAKTWLTNRERVGHRSMLLISNVRWNDEPLLSEALKVSR